MTGGPSILDELRTADQVRCPICLDMIEFEEDALYERRGGTYEPVAFPLLGDAVQIDQQLVDVEIRCPNKLGVVQTHHLPLNYLLYGSRSAPLVIGFVGNPLAGKTHLLAALVDAITDNKLEAYGIRQRPLDTSLHQDYMESVRSLLHDGRQLAVTAPNTEPIFVDAFLFTSGATTRPVAFFDVSGEDLVRNIRTSRFLAVAGALIFTVDPETALHAGVATVDYREEYAFTSVIGRLAHSRALDTVAAIVLTKSDLFRFDPPVDRWLRTDAVRAGRLDPAEIERESHDVYGFLHARRAEAWLGPYSWFPRATLHFVSATGGAPVDGQFPRGVRPRRVLEPLVAVLAMTGMIAGPEAQQVGR